MYYRVIRLDELYHYGVKGMKWGVRKEYVPKGRKRSPANAPPEKKKRKGLSKNQKIAIGAVVGAAALVGGGYVLYKTGQFDKLSEIGKNVMANSEFGGSGNNLGRNLQQIRNDSKMINSINAANHGTPGGSQNCFHTSTSYILNSVFGQKTTAKPFSGIDEVSGMKLTMGRHWNLYNSIFDGIKTKDYISESNRPKAFVDAIKDIKPGSTGILHVQGHYMNYEMNRYGGLVLVDPQVKGNNVVKVTARNIQSLNNNFMRVNRILDFSDASIRDGAEDILKHIVTGR